jgi:hypothetical protein
MAKSPKLNIQKVPLGTKQVDRPKAFPSMPQLYLELLENKQKVKPDVVDKEYVPPETRRSTPQIESPAPEAPEPWSPPAATTPEPESPKEKAEDNEADIAIPASPAPVTPPPIDDLVDPGTPERIDAVEENDNVQPRVEGLDDSAQAVDEDVEGVSNNDGLTKGVSERRGLEGSFNKKTADVDVDANRDDDLTSRLKKLLQDDDRKKDVPPEKKRRGDDDRRRDSDRPRVDKYSVSRDNKGRVPSLSELESRGQHFRKKDSKKDDLKDLSKVPVNETQEEDSKREILFKFDLLKKSYANASIPEFTVHSDYNAMKKSYESTVRRLALDTTVEQYKTYLLGGFMACEFVLGNFLGFDMQGFTQQQILSMHSYERLLIELGEKSYVPEGSRWPVELRLLFMIIMNAAFFLISKMLMKKTGANLMGMINNMNVAARPAQKKTRMKGPDIDI